ncbi:MAG: polyprenyl synthetase family protein [Rhodospirillales bacterium]|nr:polyprenyl synthetase family protein [Rhodospirillales bacterium]
MQTATKTMTDTAINPLDHLSALLSDDMKQVNALIIEHMQSDVPMIPQLAGYLIAAGGKRIRPLLTLACTRLYGDQSNRPYALAAAVEFIHTATLLHDDVVDESEERRGQKATNLVFGNQATVLVGDFLFSRAFQLMVADGSLDVLRILSDASAIIAQGEVMQLTTANNLDCTMGEYEQVIGAKTAALFAAACEIGPVIAGADKTAASALCEFGMNLGLAFQVVDDVLDYSAAQEKLGKTVGDDFREGKMTAPVLLALEKATDEERAFWQRTMGDRDQNDGDLARAQEILSKYDTINRSINLARDYAAKARLALAEAPDGQLRSLLDDLVTFTVERNF